MSAPSARVRDLLAQPQPLGSPPAAHLAEYSFRFDTAAPSARAPLPASGMDWTVAQTLEELRRRDASVDRSSRGLRLRHAYRMPQLAVAVGRFERTVAAWLDLGTAPRPALGWDDETDLLVRHLRQRPAPAEPVSLRPGVSVTDWPLFVASVEGRFAEGPEAACADGLRRDLRDVFAATEAARIRPLTPARQARAA